MILVTGANGLAGAAIMRALLQRGEKVRALKRPTSDLTWAKRYFEFHEASALWDAIEWVEGDVLDVPALEDAIRDCTLVVHAAALVSFHPKDSAAMLEINGIGTANVVNVCLTHQVERLFYMSSTAALGRSKPGEEIDESHQWETSELNTPYAISKYTAECEVWRGMEEGLRVAMVNPAIILGPGRPDRSSASLLTQVAEGLKFYPPGSNGFVGLEDVARAVLHVLDHDLDGERFLLCSQNWTYLEVFTQLAHALELSPPKTAVSRSALNWAWRMDWLREKLSGRRAKITRINANNACNTVKYNGSSIEQTGFQYTSITDSIAEAAQFYRRFVP